ncbi:MAG: VanW family protein [Candidatus Levybacteria bacterium]|nr:VanW family protein [Candidatus Levybacteria bacterium]
MDILLRKRVGHLVPFLRGMLWFFLGALLGLFFFTSFLFIFYRNAYKDVVYPGIIVNNIDFGGKSKEEVKEYFDNKNAATAQATLTFSAQDMTATTSAKNLNLGFDSNLLSNQAYTIGRSENFLSNLSLIFQAYLNGVFLPASYHYSEEKLDAFFQPMKQQLTVLPVDAVFTFENGKVAEFRSHSDGQEPDFKTVKEDLSEMMPKLLTSGKPQSLTFRIPIKTLTPKITTEKVNNMGINELVASGTSLFHGSIANRIYNIGLASGRLNGVLVKPGEVFSFAKAVGDVSKLTGYKEAYIIENGRTILGDGGGVCQVSTTLFRAALNAGLPIKERNQHAYRVHYYEEDSGPGIDAAVYVPSVDLKFKNDTGHWLLIQSVVDTQAMRLTFEIYGTKDGREVIVNDPVILSQAPAPEPLRQDDPTLPKGQVKQVDWAAPGARVYFTREVKKDGKMVISDKFTSNYRPWQAVYMVGTKEN